MRLVVAFVIGLALAGCGGVTAGSACSSDGDCGDRLTCVSIDGERSACMAPCTESTRLCADGSVCLESPSNGPVCWFGGGTPFGSECDAELACEPGAVCHEGTCTQACQITRPEYLDPRDEFDPASVCDPGQRCVAVSWDGGGVCGQ